MAQPNTQTGLGNPAGTTVQSPLPQRQVASGQPSVGTLNRAPGPQTFPPPTTPLQASVQQSAVQQSATPRSVPADAEPTASDWGIAPEKSGFSRENKFILFVLLILVAVFSFVVFRNFQKRGTKAELAAKNAENNESGESEGAGETSKSKNANAQASPLAEIAKATKKKNRETPRGAESLEQEPLENESVDMFDVNDQEAVDVAGPPAQDDFSQSAVSFEDEPLTAARTSRRGTKHRGSTTTSPDGADPADDLMDSPVAEEANVLDMMDPAESETEFAVDAPQQNLDLAEEIDMGGDNTAVTLATRPRTNVNQSEDLFEGSAESFDDPMLADPTMADPEMADPTMADPASGDLAVDDLNEFATERTVDVNLKQTGGTNERGMRNRAGRKTPADTFGQDLAPEQDLIAQSESPMLPPGGETFPRQSPAPRTGGRVSGPPTQRAANSVRMPLATDQAEDQFAEDKFGGMLPQDVRQRPAPRGQFDPQASPLVENTGEYVIRPNDNYWRISRKVYGTARYFEALRKHNENVIPNTKNMKVGSRISTPSRDLLEQQYRDILPPVPAPKPPGAVFNSPNAPPTPGYFVEPGNQPAYRVGATDTLSSISQKTLGRSSRWDEIYELNRDRLAGHDQLSVGAILRLPADASQPRLVGTPSANH